MQTHFFIKMFSQFPWQPETMPIKDKMVSLLSTTSTWRSITMGIPYEKWLKIHIIRTNYITTSCYHI